jgi:hypothetical protein
MRWIDVMNDVAFIVADLQRRQRPDGRRQKQRARDPVDDLAAHEEHPNTHRSQPSFPKHRPVPASVADRRARQVPPDEWRIARRRRATSSLAPRSAPQA